MRSIPSFSVPVLAAIIAAAGCGKNSTPTGPHTAMALDPALNRSASAGGQAYNPVIRPQDFVRTIDNPYLPLVPGTTYNYSQTTADGVETNEVAVTHDRKIILGVKTLVAGSITSLGCYRLPPLSRPKTHVGQRAEIAVSWGRVTPTIWRAQWFRLSASSATASIFGLALSRFG